MARRRTTRATPGRLSRETREREGLTGADKGKAEDKGKADDKAEDKGTATKSTSSDTSKSGGKS